MEAPLHRTRYRSREIFSRYSENSLHSNHTSGDSCVTKIPYATLMATIMCCVGVGVFCGTMHRGITYMALMLDQVFHVHLDWFEMVETLFVIIGTIMGSLALMILFVGFLTTGATRHRVYRVWRARVSGRISCAVYMVITYMLQLFWLSMFCILVIITFVFTIFYNMCSGRLDRHECIDFKQFGFMFPPNTPPDNMDLCESQEVKLFCKDYVEKAEFMFIMATSACVLIILSLVHYLICLSANYAHIRDHEKLQELQELQCLQDAELSSSRDRF